MTERAPLIAVVPAAGVGSRMKADRPKQYLPLTEGGEPMLVLTVRALFSHPLVDRVYGAVSPEDPYADALDLGDAVVLRTGGATRADTVLNTLRAVENDWPETTLAMVHDAARPLLSHEDLDSLVATVDRVLREGTAEGAVLAMPVADTVKRADEHGLIAEDVSRDRLWRIATPQLFALRQLARAIADTPDVTDESSAIRAQGGRVALVPCAPLTFKITEPADRALARQLLQRKDTTMDLRVGLGYDSHRLVEGRPLIMGGIRIEHTLGLDGHSDADVLLHAITDALLGAANMGNIGLLFPDTAAEFKDADSAVLLREAWSRIAAKGWQINNLDCVIVAERPKLNPHLPAMTARIAEILGIDVDRVSVKPKTNEKLGFEGEQKGISARVVALLTRD